MEVISLTEGKINRTYIAGKDVITKQSSFDEIKNIEIARKALTNKTILLEMMFICFICRKFMIIKTDVFLWSFYKAIIWS